MAKVQLGSHIVQRANIKYGWAFFHWKCWNKVLLQLYSTEIAKIRYGWSSIGKWGGQLKTTKPEIRDYMIWEL